MPQDQALQRCLTRTRDFRRREGESARSETGGICSVAFLLAKMGRSWSIQQTPGTAVGGATFCGGHPAKQPHYRAPQAFLSPPGPVQVPGLLRSAREPRHLVKSLLPVVWRVGLRRDGVVNSPRGWRSWRYISEITADLSQNLFRKPRARSSRPGCPPVAP